MSLFLQAHAQNAPPSTNETIVLPKSVPDPLEPMNRVIWGFNKEVMKDIIKPTSKAYRFVVRKPVRTSISNFGRNLTYPARVTDNLLQGKFCGARDETYRFLCNSTIGLGGFFDVASKWHIPKSDADFGQTLGQWGWSPKVYLVLPLYGPSNERDTVGLAFDTAANPLLYVEPTRGSPIISAGPYTYASYGITYNNLTDSVDEYVRFDQAEMDPYAEVQYAWTFVRKNRVANYHVIGTKDESSLETLDSVFFTYKDPDFLNRGKTRSVCLPETGHKLKFTFWLQPSKAPVVYIMPGLGSHRLAQSSVALAELIYKNGYSAVCISSSFNAEFMKNAATTAVPAYLPRDAHDLHVALTEIDQRLQKLYPGRLGDKALLGYSMGAMDALYTAASEQQGNQPSLLKFDRYVAINTPVRLSYGISKLDEFYRAPLEWPEQVRNYNMENTFLKVAELSKTALRPQTTLPFNAIESKFLIGLAYRFTLRDVIYNSQRRNDQGVLQEPLCKLRRTPVYQEILQYSYQDYFKKFAVPYYQSQGMGSATAEELEKAGDLRNYETGLRANPKIRVIVNQNDFLLTEEDLTWLEATFPPEQLTIFKKGGHLGNLYNPTVEKSILRTLTGLQPCRSGTPQIPVKSTEREPSETKFPAMTH